MESTTLLSSYRRIRIRNDDVLVHSTSKFKGREVGRLRGFHKLVMTDPKHFIHVAAILTTEIQDFPDAISYIKEETALGNLLPEVHGLQHIDYGELSHAEIVRQLLEAKQFIINEFNYTPTIWYSPWGAGEDARGAHLRGAALDAGLNLVTLSGFIPPATLVNEIRSLSKTGESPASLIARWEGREILRHWWEGAGALDECIKFFKANDP